MTHRALVIGAGAAGLVTAFELTRRGCDVTVLEKSTHIGGTVKTLLLHGELVDVGPELIVCVRPEARALFQAVGIEREIIDADANSPMWLVRDGASGPLPDALAGGVPKSLASMLGTDLLSWRGKLRAAGDLVLSHRRERSLGPLVEWRFGREVKEALAEPLFTGIFGTDIDRMDAAFAAPQLAGIDGSVMRALSRHSGPRENPLKAPRQGMAQLTQALVRQVGATRVRANTPVEALCRVGAGFSAVVRGAEPLAFDAVVLATPPHEAAAIVRSFDSPLADLLGGIRMHGTASVVLGFREAKFPVSEMGGFIVPRASAGPLLGATMVSNRWRGRTTAGAFVVRAIVGGGRAPASWMDASDEELVSRTTTALRRLLPLGVSTFHHVERYPGAQVSPEVGHTEKVRAVRERGLAVGPLYFIGAAYDAGGIAGIIAKAPAVAERVVEALSSR